LNNRVSIRRLATGIPGLDAILGGGLPEFSFNLIMGPPGVGKTTLVQQIMLALATAERPALYFTVLGEPPVKMLRYQQQFAFFDLDQLDVSIRFVDLSEEILAGNFAQMLARITRELRACVPALVVVDSFRSVLRLAGARSQGMPDLHQFIHQLGVLLSGWQATSFLVGDYASELEDRYTDLRFSPYGSAFLTDAIIVQRYIELDSRLLRVMAVVKVRGSAHSNDLRQFEITEDGILIGAPVRAYEGLLGGRPTRAPAALAAG